MATTTNKQQLLNQAFALLKKHYDPLPEPEKRPVLEHLLYAICREGSTREQADKAFHNLKSNFFDWNEVRVSSPHELEDALSGLPNAEERAKRLIGILQELFESTFSFDMDDLDKKKGLKEAAKALSRMNDVNDYAVAWVVQQALGGHAVPLDAPTLRVLQRLGVVDGDPEDLEHLRGSVEHLIPKARGPVFSETISMAARDFCWEDAPNCAACPLTRECPTGQDNVRAAEPRPRLKSR